jgi:hypothetical protein
MKNQLYQEVFLKDYEGETKFKQFQKSKANEYFNGFTSEIFLRHYMSVNHKGRAVEYGFYRATFICQDGINRDYIRCYTPRHDTCQKNKLYLIGFKDDSFVE